MGEASNELVRSSSQEELPAFAYTRSNKGFDPRLDQWKWFDGPYRVRIDFDSLPDNFQQFASRLKKCLLVFMKGHSPLYVGNIFNVFLHFARATTSLKAEGASITPLEIGNYSAGLGDQRAYRVGHLTPLLHKWFKLGLEGVDQATVDYMHGRRTPKNVTGEAVRTRDPEKGPFTDSEFQALFRALASAMEDQSVALWAITFVKLLAACGGRPSQYASLKILDYTPAVAGTKPAPAKIALPQVKNRVEHARMAFLDFDLSAQTSALLERYLDSLRARGMSPNSPLFPLNVIRAERSEPLTRADGEMFFDHPTGQELGAFMRRELTAIAPVSDRTGYEPIPLNPRRFRYTFGTRMAEEGASKALIADRLGHVDVRSVEVYFEASPIIVDNIDRAMGASLAPIARAFMGTLIEDESQGSQRGVPGKRIIDFRVSIKPLGGCGKDSGCSLHRPVACYTCHRFEPWLDGPHEAELQRMLADRAECDDERVAGVNDDAIEAVREVIEECRQVQASRGQQEVA
ncbi:MAG: site-specific integrase [Nevskiaceae bacterium]|nr:MAG: site-specific integrase [Nevskiaceae bacterium]